MKPFNRKDFDDFFTLLNGLDIQPIEEDINGFGFVNIRHDVDDDLGASVDFAEAELDLLIRSTYFLLDTAEYWGRKMYDQVAQIAMLGHEIGWHNNAIASFYRHGTPIRQTIEEATYMLYWLDLTSAIGTASHGDPLCYEKNFLNYYIWDGVPKQKGWDNFDFPKFKLDDFGLKYEAYFTGHTHYISDSGGQWRQDNKAVVDDFRKRLSNGEQVKLQVLIHPQWWQL